MHIPDGYLSPSTCGVLYVGAGAGWYAALKRLKRALLSRVIPLISVFAAFSFVVMMFNLPLPGGTTGHALGVTIAAIVLGPSGAILALSIALAIQALFFGDGGITTLGANCFNMAIVALAGGLRELSADRGRRRADLQTARRRSRHRRLSRSECCGLDRGCRIWHSANVVPRRQRNAALRAVSVEHCGPGNDDRPSDLRRNGGSGHLRRAGGLSAGRRSSAAARDFRSYRRRRRRALRPRHHFAGCGS